MSSTVTLTLPGDRARWLAVGAAAGLLIAVAASPLLGPRTILAADDDSPREHTISVAGVGRVTVEPDVADLRLGVSITRPTVAEARDEAAAAMTKVVAALRAAGIAERDLQTSNLSLQPVYDYDTDGKAPRLAGYQLTNTVSATVRDLDRIAEAVDGAMTAGATTMDGVTFRVDDPSTAERQARERAVADARTKAQALASAAGVSISGVSSIAESGGYVPPIHYAGEAARQAADATPIQTGTLEVRIDVAVVYTIG